MDKILKKILILIFLIKISHQKLPPIQEVSKSLKNIDISKQFPGYEVMFHFDDYTKTDLIDSFNFSYLTPRILIKYNYKNKNFETNLLKRPIGYKFVHLVFLQNPFYFELFSNQQFNLEFNDIVLFITRKDFKQLKNVNENHIKMIYIWNQRGLDKCGCIFIYDIQLDLIYYVHYYVGKATGILKEINETLKEEQKLLSYRNKFNNFNGHLFHVAYYPYEPFIWCKRNKNGSNNECDVDGIDGNILLLLSKYLNFKFIMRKAKFKVGGGIWRTMIEDVHFERRDWAIGGISTSLERLQLADFTTMLHMESYTAFYTIPNTKLEDLHGVLKPFEIASWICLVILMSLVGFLLGISQKIQQNQFYRLMRVPFRIIIDQTAPQLKLNLITARLLLSVWFLSSIILTTAYKSKLASTMIKPKILEPNTVIDLYNQGYSFQVNNEDWTVLKESLSNSIDNRYKDLLERCFDDLDFCGAVKKAFHEKVAVFDEETAMPFIIFNTCRDFFGPNEMVRFRLVKQELFPSVHAWPLRLGAPYRHRFSSTFQILISSGIVEHWYRSLIGKSIAKSNSFAIDSSNANSLSLRSFSAPFFLLITGYIISFIAFLFESIYRKFNKKIINIKF